MIPTAGFPLVSHGIGMSGWPGLGGRAGTERSYRLPTRVPLQRTVYRPWQSYRLLSQSSKMVLATVHDGPLVLPGWAGLDPDGLAGFGV